MEVEAFNDQASSNERVDAFSTDRVTTWGKVERLWATVFYVFGGPYSKYLVGKYPMPESVATTSAWKKVLDSKGEQQKRDFHTVRAIFNIRNMFDGVGFLWLKYKYKGIKELDNKARLEVELTNVGLLAALVSTICFAMLQTAFESDFPIDRMVGLAYAVSWTCASFITLCSTVLSIVVLIAVSMMPTAVQLDYFLATFEKISLGLGTMTPLYLLYLGGICTICGLLFGAGLHYSALQVMIVAFFGFLCFLLYAWCYLFMVSAVQATINTFNFMDHGSKEVSLSVEDIRLLLDKYAKSKAKDEADVDYIQTMGSCDEFLEFVIGEEVDGKKNIGDTLQLNTKRRARRIYECVIEANLLRSVKIQDVVLTDISTVSVIPSATA